MKDQGAGGARRGARFGRLKGRPLRRGQADLVKTLLPRLRVDPSVGAIDVAALYGRSYARLEVEIGFGGGERLASAAALDRSSCFIGCEPFVNGMAKILARIDALGLDNIRLYDGDGLALLTATPRASLDRVHLLYPDPWPKRRHRKRRFVSAASLDEIARVLKPEGEFRFATDIDDYAAWTLARTLARRDLVWTAQNADDWRVPWPDWPGTRYEAKALAEGRRAIYLTFRRVARSP